MLKTIQKILPEEIQYLEKYDQMKLALTQRFDMPGYLMDLLISFLQQNNGILSKRAGKKEFSAFSDKEVSEIELLFSNIFIEK